MAEVLLHEGSRGRGVRGLAFRRHRLRRIRRARRRVRRGTGAYLRAGRRLLPVRRRAPRVAWRAHEEALPAIRPHPGADRPPGPPTETKGVRASALTGP